MCLVEVENAPKPVASCASGVAKGMKVKTKSERAYNARGGVMEFLLANHPLDCPICDQGGECDLQDQSELYGYQVGRFLEYKRSVEDKEFGPLIATIMTRCIHCTRCVRFAEEVAGSPVLGTTGRGRETEIGTYVEKLVTSELSGNLVDLCPVGALTNAPYAFTARPWELRYLNSFDVSDSIGPAITVNTRGSEVMRILPRIHEDINEEWIHDRSRHSFDGLKRQRLNACLLKDKDGDFQEIVWEDALSLLGKKLNKLGGDEIAGIIGEQMDVEAIVAFRDLMHALGCENIESRRYGLKVSPDFRSNYLMNSGIVGVEDADLLLVVGSNLRVESPVLNARVRKNVVGRGLQVAFVGSGEHQTYDFEHLGNSTKTLEDLLAGSHPFSSRLQQAARPMIIVGAHALQRADGLGVYAVLQELSRKYKVIDPDQYWNGFNVLHKNVGTVAALEVGITSQYNASAKPKLVYLLGADNFRPDEIPEDAFVVYQGTHGDEGASRADLILPGAAFTEKSCTFVNTDGRVLISRLATAPPGQGRNDWEVIRALSEVLGQTLPYDNIDQVRLRLAELAPHLIKYDNLEPHCDSLTAVERGPVTYSLLSDYVDNFYMTDAISRASPVMAKCSSAFNPVRNTNFTQEAPKA
jgi:NADH dehydrogenase (ubiquinone) Fe-S protein 1